MNTEEMIRDFRRLYATIGEEFIAGVIEAELSAECTDRARSAFTTALWLANCTDLPQRGFREADIFERLKLAHNNIGYIYTLLLQSGHLEDLAKFKPFEWPYPYSALGALVARPDNMSSKHARGECYSLEGFTAFAWLGEENREQVRKFVTKICDSDSSAAKVLEIAFS